MKLHPMWQEYPALQADLSASLQLMEKSLKLKNKAVEEAILAMIHSGGKLLRPAYQLLFSSFGSDQDHEKAVALSASIEMLHTASLIHDDIVDDADTRRGLPTIRAAFGNDVAVYAGDYLFVCCFKLMADYASSMKSLQMNSRSMEKILSGELGQMSKRYDVDVTVTDYLENISGKTAELFALSCFIGAYESGTSLRFANQAKEIGESIGLAFQIMDDILDYSQAADHLGKPVLEDVRQGVYSLPLLLALKSERTQLLPLLAKKEAMTDTDTQAVYQLVQNGQGLVEAQKLAAKYTEKALQGIKKLPETQDESKDYLYRITEQILTRTN
ncbi:polyprenyl synthetase family protein [Enterococcus sp. DIV0876]|uniref:polyprenyl synthetase family protein n=1 Tax=Enterococcus sp. DIV0876 TaxID=2774633 RepID=UPI003D2FBC44